MVLWEADSYSIGQGHPALHKLENSSTPPLYRTLKHRGKCVPVHAIKADGITDVSLHSVLTSALHEGTSSDSRSSSFALGKLPQVT